MKKLVRILSACILTMYIMYGYNDFKKGIIDGFYGKQGRGTRKNVNLDAPEIHSFFFMFKIV